MFARENSQIMTPQRPASLRNHLFSWCSVILAIAAELPCAVAAPPGNGWVMAWSDEFGGSSLNTANWSVGTGNRRDAVNTANALTVANGYLRIQTYTEGGKHHTGWIGSNGKFENCFGYWEARIRFNSSAGMWSAFWLQPYGINNVGDPAGNGTEIDIVEHRSRDGGGADLRNRASMNVHWDGYGADHKSVGATVNNPGANSASLQGNWHTYGLLWEPGRYRIYIDGLEVWETTAAISQVRQWIYLTSEVQNNAWAGPVPAGGYGTRGSSNPSMDVDYVRFHQRAEQTVNSHFGHRMGPWRQQGGTGWSAGGGRDASSGGYLNPTASGGSRIEQTVAGLLPNTPYVVSGWGRIHHDDPGWSERVRIGARHYGGPEVWSGVSTRTFSATEVPFTTGASNSTAAVFGHAPVTWTKSFIDDITVSRAGRFTNGGFELGDDAHWSRYGDSFVHAWSASFRRSGLQAARLNTSTSARGFEQTIRGLKPATAYTVSMWHKGNSQPVRLGVKNHGGGEGFTGSTASGGNWKRAVHTFTTGPSATAATVFAMIPSGSNVAAVDIDDFLIAESAVPGWISADIGSGALPGESAMSDGMLAIRAAGNNLGGPADDACRFLHQTFDGIGHLSARLNSFEARHDRAKAGVMLRASTAANAAFAMVHWLPEGRVEFLYRPAAGNASSFVWSAASVPWPPHLRLSRPSAGVVAAAYSTDGSTWVDVGAPQAVALPDAALGGPVVTSHDLVDTAEAVFGSIDLVAVPVDLDADNDGLTDFEEEILGTDPQVANPEIVWWPGGTPGSAGSWHAAAAWRLGPATTGWTPGRTALFAAVAGTVAVDGAVGGLAGLSFKVPSYHLAGTGPLGFGASPAEIRLPGDGITTLSTPLSGSGEVRISGGGRLDLRGDNRGFTGKLALRDGMQLRAYHSGDGSASGHETGGSATTIDVGAGSQVRWFNPANNVIYQNAFTLAGAGNSGGNPGALNLDASPGRTVTLAGPVTTLAPATIGTQNNGSFFIAGPLTGPQPLTFQLASATSTLAGVVDLPSLTVSGTGTLAFATSAAVTLPRLIHQGGGCRFDSGSTAGIEVIELAASFTANIATALAVPSRIDGVGTLVKTGLGTLTLTGGGDYAGATTVHAGTLRLDGALTASTVTVEGNAAFAGSGSLPAATVRGTLALTAGQPPLAITGALALENATLTITGTPAGSGPVVLATYGSLTGAFAGITGVPAGWSLETGHGGGTAIALVPGGYAAWAAEHLGGQGPEEDFHGDGLPNLLRYALDIDPAHPSGFPGQVTGGVLTFHKRPAAVAAGDVTYALEISHTLAPGSWLPVIPDLNDAEMISHAFTPELPREFLRLRVSAATP